jgi:hypothetical protein
MEVEGSVPDSAATTVEPRSFISVLGDIYLAPGAAFREIARHPTVWAPLALVVVLQAAFIGVWASQMDMHEFLRNQSAQTGRPMPPPEAMDKVAVVMNVSMLVSAVVVPVLGALAAAGVLLAIYNFVLGAAGRYRQYLSVSVWTFAATSLVTTPLILLTMWLKGDWNVSPDAVLATNLSAFLDAGQNPGWLVALAKRIDIVTAWVLFLLSVGLGHVTRRPTASAAMPLVTLWLVVAGVMVAVSSIF